jgi:nitrate reductase cytochrome c-type subunit
MKIKRAIIAFTLMFTCLSVTGVFAQSAAKKISVAETKKNQKADDEFLRALQTGDVSELDDVAAPDFINHGVGIRLVPIV